MTLMTSKNKPIISAVIPAYNENQGISAAITHIAGILNACESAWEIIVVDDGSHDQTYQQICQLSKAEPRIKGLSLSRNFGKEAAMLAGLAHAKGEAVIVDASSSNDFLDLAITCITCNAVSNPSPVFENWRIITWPDCSPPRL